MLIDSHAHLFLEQFNEDLASTIERAKQSGVTHIFMPNIDSSTLKPLLDTCEAYKDICYPMIGLHPTSVGDNYLDELAVIDAELAKPNNYVAIGEIGVDLYWDKTFVNEQIVAFEHQIKLALKYDLPIVIHLRDSFKEIVQTLSKYKNEPLRGIFHSFGGTLDEASELLSFPGFMLGINGVVTFKNSNLSEVLVDVPLSRIVVETDSPYLAPVPYRGKRNESAYVSNVAQKLAEIYDTEYRVVANITSTNALKVFGMTK